MFRRRDAWWWVGVPAAMLLAAFGPYWILQVLAGVVPGEGWWRVLVMPHGVFDTYVYLHWMGAAVYDLDYGGHLHWIDELARAVARLMGPHASLPEIWLVSRWITTTLFVWIAASGLERWSGLKRWQARLVACGLFFSTILVLAMRPGIYSWYLPFCFAGLVSAAFACSALQESAWRRAIGWSLAALALTSIYPWWFIFVFVWMSAWLGVACVHFRRWSFPALGAFFAAAAIALSIPLAHWFLDPAQAVLVDRYERNGVTFAWAPFIANTVPAMFAWIIFFVAFLKTVPDGAQKRRLLIVGSGWITVFFLWFSNVFTGLFMHNDHYISVVATLSWVSLATVWSTIRDEPELRSTVCGLRIIRGVAVFAALFFLYILIKESVRNVFKLDVNAIHLTHWFALAVTAGAVAGKLRNSHKTFSDRRFATVILIGPALYGGLAFTTLILRTVPATHEVASLAPAVEEIRARVKPDERVCADPQTANVFAAHTGRAVFPAEAIFSYPITNEEALRRLVVLAGAYDSRGTPDEWFLEFYAAQYRISSCDTGEIYTQHNLPSRLLRAFGADDRFIQTFIGCRRDVIASLRERVRQAIDEHKLNSISFRDRCPTVIMKESDRPRWQLPAGYASSSIGGGYLLWTKP